jgi:hypothetical protein
MRHGSPFEIERNGLRITSIQDDPDDLPTYDRAFLYRYDPTRARKPTSLLEAATINTHDLSNREAWDIAKFITRQLVRAQALQAYKRLRQLAGLGERPPEPQ